MKLIRHVQTLFRPVHKLICCVTKHCYVYTVISNVQISICLLFKISCYMHNVFRYLHNAFCYVHILIRYVQNIFCYYTSREFPIQNFHRRTTDILYYYTSNKFQM